MNGVATYSSIPTLKQKYLLAETNIEKANLLANTDANISNTTNYSELFLNHIKENKLENNPITVENNNNNEIETLNEIFNINELRQAIKSVKKIINHQEMINYHMNYLNIYIKML